jgi:hypothetical protein
MATKIEWDIFDYAARDVLSGLLDELGASYREMENLTQGEVTYSRIRDIKMGNKAPVRLSEFLLICEVCNADPVQTLREIITEARHMELEQQTATTKKSAGERFVVDESTSEPDWLSMAAKHGDIEAEQEAYEEMP